MTLLTRLFGTAYMAYHLRGQARYPFKPLAAIRADQARRVRSMVAYAYRYVPYYRETMDQLGLRPADFRSADDLTRLPLLDRARVQRDPEHFVSTAQPLTHYLRIRNSGTTSRPCRFYHDARALYQYAAHSARARGVFTPLIGRSMGYRKTMIVASRGSADLVQQFYRRQALLPSRVRLLRQQLSPYDPPETNSLLINEFKPDVIHFQRGHFWFNLLLPLLRRYPLVITIHDVRHHPGDRDTQKTPQWLMDFAYRRANQIIVHGRQIKKMVIDFSSGW